MIGAIGPGTRLPSLGHIAYRTLEDAFAVQAAGLIAGGADVILCETCQDPLQAKAAVNGARRAMREAGRQLPLMVQVTIETTGTMLVGTDIGAAATIVGALDVPIIGLNCATGPQEMAEHVADLARGWPGPISVLPNAGLPELVDGQTRYPLGARDLAAWLERFVVEDGVAIVGGCCGTTPEHIAELDRMLRRLAEDGERPRPKPRAVARQAEIASLYSAVPLRQENAYLSIGERCNANGSKAFRERQAAADWDACVAIGRTQVQRRLARARRLHRLRRARRDRRHARGGDPPARRGRQPAGVRFDRARRARVGARAVRRQGGDQLDQLRGRRGAAGGAPGARQEVRRRRDRADHRRARHGQDGRSARSRSRAAWSRSPRRTACPATTC